jgi:trimeric autotransporter adhesin
VTVHNVARWNGSAWSALGTGIDSRNATVQALAVMPNGDLVVGGYFTAVGDVTMSSIARWDGNAWNPLGTGLGGSVPVVRALLALPSGDLIASGASFPREKLPR